MVVGQNKGDSFTRVMFKTVLMLIKTPNNYRIYFTF